MFIKSNGYFVASFYCSDGRLRYPTGIKVQSPEKSGALHLSKIEKLITQFVETQKIMDVPVLRGRLKGHLDEKLGKVKKGSFYDDWDGMLEKMRSGEMLTRNETRYSESSLNSFYYVKMALLKHEKAAKIKFSYSFSVEEYKKYMTWLVQNDYSKNAISSIIEILVLFLKRMYKAGKHYNQAFEEFKYGVDETDSIYLNVNEIQKIFDLELSGSMERARDLFVFGCWVALRVKDLSRINQYERKGDVFEVLTSKTGEKVVIPIHWMADKIYTKYKGKLPVYKSKNGFSNHLPEICKLAGIEERMLITMTRGGRRVGEYFNKYELVTPHTCRRSFATNMYIAGFPIPSIMKVTGHRSISSFLRYIKIDKEENAKLMLAHPFLKEPGAGASTPSAE